jgi:hypothetical protein
VNTDDYEILVNSMPGGKRPPDFAVKLLEDTCNSTGLDWKRRHVYLMERGGKWQVTLSIDGFRMVGSQDDAYGGQDGPYWVTDAEGTWSDVPPEKSPYAAKVGIKHKDGTTTWGIAKFKDYAAGAMWTKFPSTMIAKCAEMLAWRKAMPGRLGGLYGTEEMAQATDKPRRSPGPRSAFIEESNEGSDGESSVPPNSPVGLKPSEWYIALDTAKDLSALKEVGSQIAADKSLGVDAVRELHDYYNTLKARKNASENA